MHSYYPEDYGPHQSSKTRTSLGAAERLKQLLKFIDTDTRRVPPLPAGKMLEIGCASGAFLQRMSNLGWQVEGIELSGDAAARARSLGYPVRTGSLESAPDPAQPYDLIVGWHVFEHLHNPVGALHRLHCWSKAGGWLVLSMPDAGSWEFRLLKDKWYALQAPTHVYHYTRATLSKVLERGHWKLERLFWQRNPNNLLHSMRYWCLDLGRPNAAAYLSDVVEGRRQRVIRSALGLLLGTLRASGRMTAWARRT
jgi:SAM-dependent methyltransferase